MPHRHSARGNCLANTITSSKEDKNKEQYFYIDDAHEINDTIFRIFLPFDFFLEVFFFFFFFMEALNAKVCVFSGKRRL